MVCSGVIRKGPAGRDIVVPRLIPRPVALALRGKSKRTVRQQRGFQSTRPQLNQLAMYGKVPNFPQKPKMVKVPVPPVGQWVPVVQKSKSEKKPAEAVEVQSPKLSRTQRRRRKKASVKSKLKLEVESKPEVGLTMRYPAEGKAGNHKKLKKGQTSSAEFSDELSSGLATENDLMEEDQKDEESSNQAVTKEEDSKYQIQFGSLPEKVDCGMVLTLPREFMAKPDQARAFEKDVVDTQGAYHELIKPEVAQIESTEGKTTLEQPEMANNLTSSKPDGKIKKDRKPLYIKAFIDGIMDGIMITIVY